MSCSRPPVERILVNGKFRTQDTTLSEVSGIAISGGRIVFTGSAAEARAMAGRDTDIIDLDGRLVLPGFIDSHFHFYDWAVGRRDLHLADTGSAAELLARIKKAASNTAPGNWILGQGWNEADWPENRMPTREELDMAAPDHPLALWRCDMHLLVANSRALTLAGIDGKRPDPPEGTIDRDADGRPTGVLRELAINLLREAITPPGPAELIRMMTEGITELHSLGITGIHDVRLMKQVEAGADAFRAWQKIRLADELKLRCWVSIPGESIDAAIQLGLRSGFGDSMLRTGSLKYFSDGGMGARTAWMLEPYLDAESGMPLLPIGHLEKQIRRAHRAGNSVMVHAVGDRANHELARIFADLGPSRKGRQPEGTGPIHHRIEHVQMIAPADLERLGAIGMTVCATPPNLVLDMAMIDACVGPRGQRAYAFRDMIDSGLLVLFSSDCPVCDPNPFVGIHAAVTRQRKDGTPREGWYPLQRVTVDEAVRAYTLNPAIAHGMGHRLGSLSPGKYADLTALDRDIYEINPMEIAETRVDMTLFDGQVVHRKF